MSQRLFITSFKNLGDVVIKCIIIFGSFIPIITLIYKLYNPNVLYGWWLFGFICLLAIERIWETFYSAKERRPHKLHGDWTLPLVSIAYIILVLGIVLEFFLIPRTINYLIASVGLFLFVLSFLLRIWGIRTLKKQWSVHAVGAQKVKEVFLVTAGPYKYVRHPVYVGIMVEVLSLPLIWNTYCAFIFALFVNVPLQIVRAHFEEKSSIRKLGEDYSHYRRNTPAFLPLKILTSTKV